jgi:hypothetical protein
VSRPDTQIKVVVVIKKSNAEGKIEEASILKGYNDIYNKEALRVVKSIPEWDVLYRHGELFNILYMVPVVFENEEK